MFHALSFRGEGTASGAGGVSVEVSAPVPKLAPPDRLVGGGRYQPTAGSDALSPLVTWMVIVAVGRAEFGFSFWR